MSNDTFAPVVQIFSVSEYGAKPYMRRRVCADLVHARNLAKKVISNTRNTTNNACVKIIVWVSPTESRTWTPETGWSMDR